MGKALAVAAVAVVLAGCGQRPSSSYLARYLVKDTPEAQTCWRECLLVETTCLTIPASGMGRICRERQNECLTTCPGGYTDPAARAPAPAALSPAPAPPPRQLGPPKCAASELPEWAGASAGQKKELLDRCRGD